MLKHIKNTPITLILIVFFTGSFTPAYAYLDPGTGSLIIQGLIGAVAAFGFFVKLYWHKFKLMITGGKVDEEDVADKTSEDKLE